MLWEFLAVQAVSRSPRSCLVATGAKLTLQVTPTGSGCQTLVPHSSSLQRERGALCSLPCSVQLMGPFTEIRERLQTRIREFLVACLGSAGRDGGEGWGEKLRVHCVGRKRERGWPSVNRGLFIIYGTGSSERCWIPHSWAHQGQAGWGSEQ